MTLIRTSDRRLPNRIMFRNLKDAVKRGRVGKEKESVECVDGRPDLIGMGDLIGTRSSRGGEGEKYAGLWRRGGKGRKTRR